MLGRLTARMPLLHGGAAPWEGPSAETASVQREEEAPGGQHRLARRERGTRGTRDTLGQKPRIQPETGSTLLAGKFQQALVNSP